MELKHTVKYVCLVLAVMSGTSTMSAFAKPAATKAQAKPAAASPAATRAPAAAGAGNAAVNAALKSYAEQLQGKIAKNWWDYPSGKFSVVLTITINADGSATDMLVKSTPASTQAEQAASDAFNKAQPLPALPSGASSAKLTATFDSTADQFTSKTNLSVKMDPAAPTPAAAPAEAAADESKQSN